MISQHVISRTTTNVDLTRLHTIFNEEVMNVHMACALTTGLLSILFQQNGTLVILIYQCRVHIITQGHNKMVAPQDLSRCIINCNNLTLSRTFGVNSLLMGNSNEDSFPKGHASTGMRLKILMHSKSSIDKPLYESQLNILGLNMKGQVYSITNILEKMLQFTPVILIWSFDPSTQECNGCSNVMMILCNDKQSLRNSIMKCLSTRLIQ